MREHGYLILNVLKNNIKLLVGREGGRERERERERNFFFC